MNTQSNEPEATDDLPVFDRGRPHRRRLDVASNNTLTKSDLPILLFTRRLGMSPPRQIVTARVLGDPPPGRWQRMAAIQAEEERIAKEKAAAVEAGVFAHLDWGK